jgi:phosphoribosylglycinamide formyltransferase 1
VDAFFDKEPMSKQTNTNTNRLRIAVLVSGGGTNLQALLDRAATGQVAVEIAVVASDRAEAFGLLRAQRAGVPTHVVDYKACLQRDMAKPLELQLPVDLEKLVRRQKILKIADPDRLRNRLATLVLAEQQLIEVLDNYQPDYVCLAGFMRLLSPYFLGHYNREGEWRVLNIHPALLPAFPGQHGYDDTFGYGCKWGGITVHFADEGEDTGPIIAQAVYPIWPDDDLEKVRQRGLSLEYELYAQCLNWLAADQVELYPGGNDRVFARITDPAYRQILKEWTKIAFGSIHMARL